jgi:acyl-CoA thioesterase-1
MDSMLNTIICRLAKWTPKAGRTIIVAGLMGLMAQTTGMAQDVGLPQADSKPVKIVAFGDSLTAGYMLEPSAAFPVQLEAALKKRGHNVIVENAGVSGDTTAAGLARLDWAITPDTDAVILELGANDALRGIDPQVTKANLDQILRRLRERSIKVLIAGMIAPKNLGEAYSEEFDPIFAELAQTYDALYYPFFLDGVATQASLNLDDGMHPSREGVAEIVRRILPKVEDLIAGVKAE